MSVAANRLKSTTDRPSARDGSKTLSQLDREFDAWAAEQPMTTRCQIWGCDWTHEGTAAEGRAAFETHRAAEHPTAHRIAMRDKLKQVGQTQPRKITKKQPNSAVKEMYAEPDPEPEPVPEERETHAVGPDGSRSSGPVALRVLLLAAAERLELRATAYRTLAEGVELLARSERPTI